MTTAEATTPITDTASHVAAPLLADNGLGMSDFLKPTVEETTEATPTPTPVAVVETKDTPPPSPVPASTDTTPSDDAPEKVTKLQKQLKDTRDAFTQERQTNKQLLTKMQTLEASITVLSKKFDGTYDERADAPKTLTPQEVEAAAESRATIRTSHFAAVEYLMARDHLTEEQASEKVQALVWNDDAPFRQFDKDPVVQARVMGAKVPIIEAMKVVSEAEAKKKYGADPAAMHAAIEKELRLTLEKEVRDKVLKELKGKGVHLDELKGLGDVRSVSPERSPQASAAPTLESLFPNFKP